MAHIYLFLMAKRTVATEYANIMPHVLCILGNVLIASCFSVGSVHFFISRFIFLPAKTLGGPLTRTSDTGLGAGCLRIFPIYICPGQMEGKRIHRGKQTIKARNILWIKSL